jgi:coenzyme PQQ precursor peptide PqqA
MGQRHTDAPAEGAEAAGRIGAGQVVQDAAHAGFPFPISLSCDSVPGHWWRFAAQPAARLETGDKCAQTAATCDPTEEEEMTWKEPRVTEIALALEINSYACAEIG